MYFILNFRMSIEKEKENSNTLFYVGTQQEKQCLEL